MKRRLEILPLLLAFLLFGQTGFAAPPAPVSPFQKLLQSAKESLSSGMTGDAHTFIEDALRETGGDPLKEADCYELLAKVQINESVMGLAAESYQKALDLRESKLGGKHPTVVRTLQEYADLLQKVDRKDEAQKLLARVAAAAPAPSVGTATKTGVGAASGKTAAKGGGKTASKFDQYVLAAHDADNKSDNDTAFANWKAAAEEAERTGSKERQAYATLHLGDKFAAKKDNEQATANYQKSLSLRQSGPGTLGMARTLNRLATQYMTKQNYPEARKLLEQALAIEDQTPGSETVKGTTLQMLGAIMSQPKGDLGRAEELSKALLELSTKSSGALAEQQRNSANAMLMGVYFQTNRMQEGMRLRDQVMPSLTQAASPEKVKAVQAAYAAAEKAVDDTEEKSFKP